MVREEMQSQGMKLAGALLAGIGTVNVQKIPEKSMLEEAGLPEACVLPVSASKSARITPLH